MAKLIDQSGVTRFEGQIENGGSQPQQGFYTVDDVVLAGAGSAAATIEYQSGDALLDLSDPTTPLIVTSGWYALTLSGSNETPNTTGTGIILAGTTMNAAGQYFLNGSFTLGYVQQLAAGDSVAVFVGTDDAAGAHAGGSLLVVKLA